MKNKLRLDRLRRGVESILAKDGCAFSEEDKALLETILVELEEMSNFEKDYPDGDSDRLICILSLLLRFLKFFGIQDVTDLF